MHLLHLEKMSKSHFEGLLREAEVERMIRASAGQQPGRAWALNLGRGLVRLGHTFERFGQPGHIFSLTPSE